MMVKTRHRMFLAAEPWLSGGRRMGESGEGVGKVALCT